MHEWDVSDGLLAADRLLRSWRLPSVFAREPPPARPRPVKRSDPHACERGRLSRVPCAAQGIRALDCDGPDAFVVGTSRCELWEAGTERPRCLVYGHAADIAAAAWHPARAGVFASVTEAGRLALWDADQRDMTRTAAVGFAARAVAISPQQYPTAAGHRLAHHIAVGGAGGFVVLARRPDRSAPPACLLTGRRRLGARCRGAGGGHAGAGRAADGTQGIGRA